MYIHVPTAWLGMGGWSEIAISSIVFLVWRHPLASVAARAIAAPGAVFAGLCLVTGSIWGRPTWGTWRSEEHTSELQSLMRISYAVFCLKKKKKKVQSKVINTYNIHKHEII